MFWLQKNSESELQAVCSVPSYQFFTSRFICIHVRNSYYFRCIRCFRFPRPSFRFHRQTVPRVSEKSLEPSDCPQHDQLLHSSFKWSPGILTVRALVSVRWFSRIAVISQLINRSFKFERLGNDTPLPVLSLFPVSTQRKSESE